MNTRKETRRKRLSHLLDRLTRILKDSPRLKPWRDLVAAMKAEEVRRVN